MNVSSSSLKLENAESSGKSSPRKEAKENKKSADEKTQLIFNGFKFKEIEKANPMESFLRVEVKKDNGQRN